ncbi:MAG TPA: hypothetical protein VGB77_12845 [Abditibacteriaceae bacterium]
MVTRSFPYDEWQEIIDALPPEQSDLEDHIALMCEDIDTDPIPIEMTPEAAEVVDRIREELVTE